MKMKKFLLIFLTITAFSCFNAFSGEKIVYQNFELDKLIHEIEYPQKPVITDDYIIFTADKFYRFVGIAFDFENYQQIHPFQVLSRKIDDETSERQLLFYCYKRTHKITQINYRLILDGLWTTDPHNPDKYYDENTNLFFSKIEDPVSIKILTEATQDNGVHFVYKGETNQTVYLTGSFTNWDPWIYQLTETKRGLYELTLPLPTGKYYYTYCIGLTPVLDNTNPNKAYSIDGRTANVITVD